MITYFDKSRNQYHGAETVTPAGLSAQGFRFDMDGNLIAQYVAADMNCDGLADFDDVRPFVLAISNPAAYQAAYPNCNILNGDANGDGVVDFGDINMFVDLLSAASGLRMAYTWDGENRLIGVAPPAGTEQDGNLKVEFGYDYLGRRVQKKVFTRTGGEWVLTLYRKFVWDGWLLLMELDGLGGTGVPPVRKYTWGLDLAGLNGAVAAGLSTGRSDAGFGAPALQVAGGIGGLLALYDTLGTLQTTDDRTFLYFYDGNGNVGQFVERTFGPGGR
jgi:hypothetical protein